MLSEDFDKKIREAADHHHPAYDENAWKGMKKLLDKYMPEQEDKKRRFLFLWLLFLLLGGGAAWFFAGQPAGKKERTAAMVTSKQPAGTTKQQQAVQNENIPQSMDPVEDALPGEEKERTKAQDQSQGPDAKQPGSNPDATVTLINNTGGVKKVITQKGIADRTNPPKPDKKVLKDDGMKQSSGNLTPTRPAPVDNTVNKGNKPTPEPDKTIPAVTINTPTTAIRENKDLQPKDVVSNGKTAPKDQAATEAVKPKEEAKNDAAKPKDKTPAKKIKLASKKKSTFFFTVSGGPDVSFTGNDKLGRMKFMGGGGIGYTYKGRFTLRTGFYTARKIYTSSPEQYHGSSRFYFYYPNLQRVEADCKVYEIPLSLSYNFGAKGKHNWFASAGISTILMKQETYDYYFKYYASNPTLNHRQRTIKNANEHYFSMLTLSAGYQRSFGRRFAVTAEPYFKVPVTGIGSGAVKLNSTGVLFTLSVNPFQKKEKK